MFFAGMNPVCACHDDFYLQRQGRLLARKELATADKACFTVYKHSM